MLILVTYDVIRKLWKGKKGFVRWLRFVLIMDREFRIQYLNAY